VEVEGGLEAAFGGTVSTDFTVSSGFTVSTGFLESYSLTFWVKLCFFNFSSLGFFALTGFLAIFLPADCVCFLAVVDAGAGLAFCADSFISSLTRSTGTGVCSGWNLLSCSVS